MNSTASLAIELQSPHKVLCAQLHLHEGRAHFTLRHHNTTVIEPSPLGITVDSVDLGDGVTLSNSTQQTIDETYATRGWHTQARNHCNTVQVQAMHQATGTKYFMELRLFDDGFAFRYVVPGEGARIVNGEASSWKIPADTGVWLAERNNDWKLKSYAGWWIKTEPASLPTVSSQGPVQAPPLVIELPSGGFAAITEAALTNYSGMRLRAAGNNAVQADFTEGNAGFAVDGPITSPWRVTLFSPDLNGLVNSDVLTSLNPPPAADFYSDTDFIRPGRVVWRWWSSGTGTPEQEKQYADYAAQLGFEYSLVDDGWEAWPDKWNTLADVCSHARAQGIGTFVWKDYKDMPSPENDWQQMREFLDGIKAAGAVGVKIDFMNAESKDRIDFQMAALRLTAQRRLMLLFHGCQKPSGESRTYPHEVTREGIRGLELNKMAEGPITAAHNAALPFTRFLCGHGDYTPVGYSNPGPTTFAHQLATAIVFTSPLQVIAEDPKVLLEDARTQPALDILTALPSVWDETRVLPPSKIGELAIFARRSGDTWFLAALNNETPVSVPNLALSFLGENSHRAILLRSPQPQVFVREERAEVNASTSLDIHLQSGDGLVAVFEPA